MKKAKTASRKTQGNIHVKKEFTKKALFAQHLLVVYNIIEGVLSLFFGSISNSIALVGFGLDSVVESLSTITVTLRLKKSGKVSKEEEHKHEKNALTIVGYSFFVLAIYTASESMRKLVLGERPEASLVGIAIATASIITMPVFAKYRHDIGHKIGSKSLIADSKQTMLCAYMSIALLTGIGLNYVFGWWWTDPIVGLLIAAAAVQEGVNSLKGEECCKI